MSQRRAISYCFLIAIVTLIIVGSAHAQQEFPTPIQLSETRYKSTELIEQIESQSEITFIFNPNDVKKSVDINSTAENSITDLLQAIVRANRVKYRISQEQIILFKPVKKKKIPVHTINGYIEDSNSSERLIGSHLLCPTLGKGTVSNESGFFSFTIPRGSTELSASYIGYQDFSTSFQLQQDTTIVIRLQPDTYINEIEIIARKKKLSEQSEMGIIRLSQEELNSNPSILGESDIIQSIKNLPGVSSTGDFTAGLLVRGGNQDQNLVQLDGVTLYNITHLLGIFSIFNTDVVKTSTLIKGAFPARYGGRLSSILDIRMNDGDLQEIHGNASVSLIASKFTLQGPIIKNKTSFIISGRRSYADLILKPFINISDDVEDMSTQIKPKFNFYDAYFKLQHIINKDQRIFLNFYRGGDRYGFESFSLLEESQNQISWGNNLLSLRWNWELSNKLFMNSSLNYLGFKQAFSFSETTKLITSRSSSIDYKSEIQDLTAKLNFDYVPSPEHFLRFGVHAQQHSYNPGSSTLLEQVGSAKLDTTIFRRNIRSTELNAYIEDDITLNRWSINVGLHLSAFLVDDEIYTSIQPRVSANYQLVKDLSLKASYSRMTQYNYIVTSETSYFISDLWVSSTSRLKPQDSWQTSAGVVYTPKNQYELSIEAYYKRMKNILSFTDGIENTFGSNSSDWESELLQGNGTSYGVELFARKTKGKLNGWLAYTLSWNNRQFDGINEGKKYPFKYDSRHQFSAVGNYQVSKKIKISAQWNYATGRYTTISTINVPSNFQTIGREQFVNGVETPVGRNNFKLSDTHRLDFDISFTKVKKRYTRIWSIGLINAYQNKNPVYVRSTITPDPVNPFKVIKQLEEVSLLPVLPSISYRIEF